MIKQSWNIEEGEKLRILNLHESATKSLYLAEQKSVVVGTETKTEDKKFPKTNLGDKFEFGKFESENVKKLLSDLKPKIDEFIKNSSVGESRRTTSTLSSNTVANADNSSINIYNQGGDRDIPYVERNKYRQQLLYTRGIL